MTMVMVMWWWWMMDDGWRVDGLMDGWVGGDGAADADADADDDDAMMKFYDEMCDETNNVQKTKNAILPCPWFQKGWVKHPTHLRNIVPMSLNPFCIKGQHGEQLVSHNGKRYHNPSVKSPGIEDATHLIRKNKYATMPELHVWEDMGRSSRIQMSSVFANLKDLKKTGPDPVLRATSLRSAPYGVFSVRESLPYDFSSPRDDPRRGGCREGTHFLNTWIFWCLPDVYIWKFHLLPILSCPVLSLQASSQYDSLSESQTHSHESSKCEKCPIWSFKHDKFRKKLSTINHYPWCILKVDVPLKHGSWMNQIVSNSFPPIILKYLP